GPAALCFFFQAEDGIRGRNVTGVQTCALPIFLGVLRERDGAATLGGHAVDLVGHEVRVPDGRYGQGDEATRIPAAPLVHVPVVEIGRASCRERVEILVGAGSVE